MSESTSIGIYGTGNVAWNLGKALAKHFHITGVYGRDQESAQTLAHQLRTQTFSSAAQLYGSDLIICAISDDAIPEVMGEILKFGPVASTSGTVDVAGLFPGSAVGVLYPMQSFIKGKAISLDDVPFFVESADKNLEDNLFELASTLSSTTVRLAADQRKKLHLSAVFINNFATHMIATGQRLAKESGLDTDWYKPLIRQLFEKLEDQNASEILTGPAKRGDRQTISAHLELLKEEDARLYQLISDHIISQYHSND